jgi:hypothetical protein
MFFSPFKIASADNSRKNFWVGYETSDLAAIDVRKTDMHINFEAQRFAYNFEPGNFYYRFGGGFAAMRDDRESVLLYDTDGTYAGSRNISGGGTFPGARSYAIDQNDVVYSTGDYPTPGPSNVFFVDNGSGIQTMTLTEQYEPYIVRMLPNGNLVFTGRGPGSTLSIFISDPIGNVLYKKDVFTGGFTTAHSMIVGPTRIFFQFDWPTTGTKELYAFDHALGTRGQLSGIYSPMVTNQNDQLFTLEDNILRRRDKDLAFERQTVIGFSPIVQDISTDQFDNIYFTTYDSGTGDSKVWVYSQSSLFWKEQLIGSSDRFIGAAADYMPVGTKTIWE